MFLNGSNWRYGVYSNLSGWSDPMHLDDSGDYEDWMWKDTTWHVHRYCIPSAVLSFLVL